MLFGQQENYIAKKINKISSLIAASKHPVFLTYAVISAKRLCHNSKECHFISSAGGGVP
jgi:hypothetical protein